MFLDPTRILLTLPGLVSGFVLHELGHAYVAYSLGDPSPRYTGRLSLNPIRHIDPVGFLLLLTAGFGWAKPVQVNPLNLSDPRRGMALVALAGPLANFLLALLFLIALRLLPVDPFSPVGAMLRIGAWINVAMGVFNLLPVPPLDGSRVLGGLLPLRWVDVMALETYGWLILILLIVSGVVGMVLRPLVGVVMAALEAMADLVPALGQPFF